MHQNKEYDSINNKDKFQNIQEKFKNQLLNPSNFEKDVLWRWYDLGSHNPLEIFYTEKDT